jgi:hypothetical protein
MYAYSDNSEEFAKCVAVMSERLNTEQPTIAVPYPNEPGNPVEDIDWFAVMREFSSND